MKGYGELSEKGQINESAAVVVLADAHNRVRYAVESGKEQAIGFYEQCLTGLIDILKKSDRIQRGTPVGYVGMSGDNPVYCFFPGSDQPKHPTADGDPWIPVYRY